MRLRGPVISGAVFEAHDPATGAVGRRAVLHAPWGAYRVTRMPGAAAVARFEPGPGRPPGAPASELVVESPFGTVAVRTGPGGHVLDARLDPAEPSDIPGFDCTPLNTVYAPCDGGPERPVMLAGTLTESDQVPVLAASVELPDGTLAEYVRCLTAWQFTTLPGVILPIVRGDFGCRSDACAIPWVQVIPCDEDTEDAFWVPLPKIAGRPAGVEYVFTEWEPIIGSPVLRRGCVRITSTVLTQPPEEDRRDPAIWDYALPGDDCDSPACNQDLRMRQAVACTGPLGAIPGDVPPIINVRFVDGPGVLSVARVKIAEPPATRTSWCYRVLGADADPTLDEYPVTNWFGTCTQCGGRPTDPPIIDPPGPGQESNAITGQPGSLRGLGDLVERGINAVTFGRVKKKPGCGCEKRQKYLNELVPFKGKDC